MLEERIVSGPTPRKAGISEDAYEIMTTSADNCDNEYLLPNSALKPSAEDSYLASGSHDNTNYEYIQYGQLDNRAASSSDSSSLRSSESNWDEGALV